MKREERLEEAYEHLRSKGIVHTQNDVAFAIKANKTNVSYAFSGNPKYLTDKFLKRFNNAFGEVFQLDWLLTGEGEMLKEGGTGIAAESDTVTMPREVFDQINDLIHTVKSQQDSIKDLSSMAESIFRLEKKIDEKGAAVSDTRDML